MILQGRVWRLGDGIRATDIVASRYDKWGMSEDWRECARHLLEDVDPGFAGSVRQGDILVAGANFGAGHAHYHLTAIQACRFAGVAAMFAESVNGLFQRAAIDHGMPAWRIDGIAALAAGGDRIALDLAAGEARNLATGRTLSFQPVSRIILDLLAAGGTLNRALQRIGADHLMRPVL